jgi:uncharacterized protein (TIGR02453 family)
MAKFGGFPKETARFLQGVAVHNEKAWFDAHRDLYEAGYVEPARAFVAEIGPRLRKFAPETQFEPKVNGSIGRVNRDIRFSKDKRPYKTHLDLFFWQGETKSWDIPGFWFSLGVEKVYMGSGIYMFDKEQLASFRDSVIHPRSGKALLAAVAGIRKKGAYYFGEKTRKLLPRGYEAPEDRAEYLLFEGLHAGIELPAELSTKPDFVEVCLKHFKATWPISQWILTEL